MSVFRAFIAVDLPHDIHQCLDQISATFKDEMDGMPVRWVSTENIHLTLKFLGDVSVANTEMLTKILESIASSHQPFELSVGGIGAFPTNRRPRVIWIGVEAPPELYTIQRSVDHETARVGYKVESRKFSPHLTMGRVSRNARPTDVHHISTVLDKIKLGFLGVARVGEIHLYRSDLKPTGAEYTRVFSAAFR